MADRKKGLPYNLGGIQYSHLIKGTAIPSDPVTDPDSIFSSSTGLAHTKDYDPASWIVGFEVHGAQTGTVVVEYANGSTATYTFTVTNEDNEVFAHFHGKLIKKILSSSTASGIFPLFM
jgi:hypothetical protein